MEEIILLMRDITERKEYEFKLMQANRMAAIDMSPAYIRAVTDNLPKVTIVFDRFHIIKLFNEKLSDLRRQLYHELNDPNEKRLLKGTRWLLLKNPDKLDDSREEPQRLEKALEINKPSN